MKTNEPKHVYRVRFVWENRRYDQRLAADSPEDALDQARRRVKSLFPSANDPIRVSLFQQRPGEKTGTDIHDTRRAAVERPIIDAEFPEADAAPPPVRPCAVTNDAVRVLVERRHTLEHGIGTQEEEICRIERRLVAQRSDLDAVRAALEAIGADPNEAHEEEF